MAVASFVVLVAANTTTKEQKSLVYFDKERLEARLVRQLAEMRSDEKQAIHISLKFKRAMSAALQDYSKKNHASIVDKKMFFAGGEDITKEIEIGIAKLMRDKK